MPKQPFFHQPCCADTQSLDPILSRKEAARYLGVAPGTMAVWDCTKRYDLKPLKAGRSVRYRRSSLDAFLNRQLHAE